TSRSASWVRDPRRSAPCPSRPGSVTFSPLGRISRCCDGKEKSMRRRNFIGLLLMGSASATVSVMAGNMPAFAATYRVTKSDAEWKKALSPAAYDVLRHQGTEMPYSSPLDMNYKKGTYLCAGCNQPVYSWTPNTTATPAGPVSGNRCRTPFSPATT